MSDEHVYEHAPKSDEPTGITSVEVDQTDRGLFDFIGGKKKEEETKCEDEVIATEFEQKVQVSEPDPDCAPESEEKKETLFAKLHRSDSSSSSSSEEEGEDGEKRKKKKPIKEKIKDKIEEHKEKKVEKQVEKHEADTYVPVTKYEEFPVPTSTDEVIHHAPTPVPEEKKGFMEKIKEKLPGGHKKTEQEHVTASPPPPVAAVHDDESEQKEKKGIFEKIKEKIPGYHSKSEEEKEKEKVKECD